VARDSLLHIYNYAFYVFGMSVTKLYIPWIAILVLAGYACVLGMGSLDGEEIGRSFSRRMPRRIVGAYMAFVAVMVGFLWVSRWVKFVREGTIPDMNGSASAYQVIATVDLIFLVPMFVVAGYLLLSQRPWGDVAGRNGAGAGGDLSRGDGGGVRRGVETYAGIAVVVGLDDHCVVNSGLCLARLAVLLVGAKRRG
jgi:hypothetical protein